MLSFPRNALRISSCSFPITRGLRTISDMAHSVDEPDVPVPPANMSCVCVHGCSASISRVRVCVMMMTSYS